MKEKDTKTRILDAAQTEFSEKGFDGASIRGIAERADVQIAAIRYHIGSKDVLFRAVFQRHAAAIARRREEIQAAHAAGSGDETIEDVIRSIIGPVVGFHFESPEGQAFAKLIANIMSNPDDRSRALTAEFMDPATHALVDRIMAAVPGLERDTAYWSFFLTIGAMAMACSNWERLDRISSGACNPEDAKDTIDALVTFAAGGARAMAARKARQAAE